MTRNRLRDAFSLSRFGKGTVGNEGLSVTVQVESYLFLTSTLDESYVSFTLLPP